MTQSALAKERRELRDQQQRSALEAIPKDLSRPWEDPLPEPGERHLAQVCMLSSALWHPLQADTCGWVWSSNPTWSQM